MSKLQLFAKGGLILLIIVSMAVLVERLTDARRWVYDVDDEEIIATVSPTADIQEPSFAEIFSECLTKYSVSSYFSVNQTSSVCKPHKECMYYFLIDTSKLLESLDVKILLLEPSLLFCVLPSSRKYNLVTRGFNSNKLQPQRNVVTFGIQPSDSKILDEAKSRKEIISAGYRILRFERQANSSSFYRNYPENDVKTFHYFIIRQDMLMHLIVLNSRETYIWSPGFNTSEINLKGLQYVNDRAFENFTFSSVHLEASSTAQILLPFDTRCFLLDFMSSSFVECKNLSTNMIPSQHPEVVMALKELKQVLASQMVIFWLWSKTLQGWFENCDILHFTEELKFSVAAKSVQGYNFTGLFGNSGCQHIESNYNMNASSIKNIKLNCHGVSIDLIFMYDDNVAYWYEYVDHQNIYRLNFPKFTLCSTDVLGEKIIIPCETSEIFDGDYGQFLKNTTLIFDSDSMKNVVLLDKT